MIAMNKRVCLSNDWVVIDYSKYPNELWCKRCNARQKYPEGDMSIGVFVAIGKAFIKLHKDCRVEKEGNENE
jgi:hypothetical protein